MSQRQKDAVYGYVRLEYGDLFIKEIIDIIYEFYLLYIGSNILNSEEEESLINLLYDTIKSQKGYEKIKSIQTKLLFRASEHDYNSRKFHELCDGQGATVTIIHNEHDYIFGGYISESWPKILKYGEKWSPDWNAFLFVIRPNCKCFELKEEHKNSDYKEVIYSDITYGPVFGEGCDIFITDRCHENKFNGGVPSSFTHTKQELYGGRPSPR